MGAAAPRRKVAANDRDSRVSRLAHPVWVPFARATTTEARRSWAVTTHGKPDGTRGIQSRLVPRTDSGDLDLGDAPAGSSSDVAAVGVESW